MSRKEGERYRLNAPLPLEVWQQVANASQIRLYSLREPKAFEVQLPDQFHSYAILGFVEVNGDNRQTAFYEAFRAGADAGTLAYRCWDPHHGVRISHEGHLVDFVICFTCECMQVFLNPQSDRFEWADISNGPESLFDEMLTEAGVPLAPRMRI